MAAIQASIKWRTRTMAGGLALKLNSVSKDYHSRGSATPALHDFSLQAPAGSHVAILGPSGCGKSTLLRCIGGICDYEGEIWLGDRERRTVAAGEMPCDWLPQRSTETFIPHRTLAQNIELAARLRGDRPSGAEAIMRAAESLGVAKLLRRRPGEVSGGELQRAALCRTMLSAAPLVLLDEPLTGVDEQHRHGLRRLLGDSYRSRGATVVWVSHDAADAFALADLCIILREGSLQQSGRPIDLMGDPETEFVLRFFGAPELNTLQSDEAAAAGMPTPSGAQFLVRANDVLIAPIGTEQPADHILLGEGPITDQRWIGDGMRISCHPAGRSVALVGAARGELSGKVRASTPRGKIMAFEGGGRRLRI